MRQSANFSSRVVGTAYKGQTYTIYEKKNGLYRIGQNRWVTASATYVSSNGSVSAHNTAPSPTSVKSRHLRKMQMELYHMLNVFRDAIYLGICKSSLWWI
ncbi:SH3 domain-containing protein [Priestia megaterium]